MSNTGFLILKIVFYRHSTHSSGCLFINIVAQIASTLHQNKGEVLAMLDTSYLLLNLDLRCKFQYHIDSTNDVTWKSPGIGSFPRIEYILVQVKMTAIPSLAQYAGQPTSIGVLH